MNERFSVISHQGLPLLVYLPWWEEGILHGMTLRDVSFRAPDIEQAMPLFYNACGTCELLTLKQTHSDSFLDIRPPGEIERLRRKNRSLLLCQEGDAVIAWEGLRTAHGLAVGVTTADCVPVMVRSPRGWAVIHAGWRGLANGIIAKVASALGDPHEAVVLACAGPERYEVGEEVVEAIGASAVTRSSSSGRALLDTAATACKQLLEFLPEKSVHRAGVCSIGDARFHSYRRDGERAGRNLTFIMMSSR